MAEDFRSAVEDGLRLSKRIYFGDDRKAPPKPPPAMERSNSAASTSPPPPPQYLPTCPMMYAVIGNPEIVDNPDMPSYQPYVHGKLDPPALMPLQMNRISMEVDCAAADTAVVAVAASWRVHCVMGSRACDCLLALPVGEQGSILGVEIDIPMRSFRTQIASAFEETANSKKSNNKAAIEINDHPHLTPNIFTVKIPKIDGGTNLSVKLRWSQRLVHHGNGQFTLQIPFAFPEYVTPAVKKISKHEKIQIGVTPCPGTDILCVTSSHPMKEKHHDSLGKRTYLYEADVLSWSKDDLVFSYTVSSSNTFGTVLLGSSPDVDGQRMFCCYLYPGTSKPIKTVFTREVVFVVDISGSMKGKVLDDTKNAILAALAKLSSDDSFNVIAFNSESHQFSSSLCPATHSCIEEARQWINENFVAAGGTNISHPLNQAMEMFSNNTSAIPVLFLVTDGSVEDERQICDDMKNHFSKFTNVLPRVYTLGIGSFCNHHFLRKLSLLGGGYHDAVLYADSIKERMKRLFDRASEIFLTDIAFENLDKLHDVEVFPSRIPDITSGTAPLIVLGRYQGTFPETLQARGTLSDNSNISMELKVQEAEEEVVPISKMLAKQEVEILTAEAWYSDSQELKKKIADICVRNNLVSEYTDMILLETVRRKTKADKTTAPNKPKVSSKVADSHGVEEPKPQKILVLRNIGIGFGNLRATAENLYSGTGYQYAALEDENGGSSCCRNLCRYCCGMGCIQILSKINDQLAVALTQLCCGFTCWGCFECCSDACSTCCECCEG
ncbi:uncharacterized protein LOC127239611 isoform X2 [Andrographis paniculata]|uniref:uncharacterized protein LOC127239611 isoform X2 n=1 Tax=Andrographis paniculata TaxID=175694 RepID=UPI0021E7FB59|nr:uncharacterized protein LOC127239611 isoform X2 [Andrographis paniculata]